MAKTLARKRLPAGAERSDLASQATILERLEVTKKYGLVADYLVSWSGIAGRHSAKVTVWGRTGTPEDVVQHYVAKLLKGIVPQQQISVAAD